MSGPLISSRRQLLAGAGLAVIAAQFGFSRAALAAGPKRKLIWVPQALGDWDTALQVGAKDFCEMAGWDYQRIGNPNYSAENHVEQVNNAIAAKPNKAYPVTARRCCNLPGNDAASAAASSDIGSRAGNR